MTSDGSKSPCRRRICRVTARSRPRFRYQLPAANANLRGLAFGICSCRGEWIWCSRTPARRVACRNARRSPTWPRLSGVRYNPHVWGTGIAIAASLQLLAVLPTHTPTSLAPIEPMLEFDRTEHPIRKALLTRPIEHLGGIVHVPDGPGARHRDRPARPGQICSGPVIAAQCEDAVPSLFQRRSPLRTPE